MSFDSGRHIQASTVFFHKFCTNLQLIFLGGLVDAVEDPITINYEDIPNFPKSTVEGHAGQLIFGLLSSVPVVCMKGRFHYFEGQFI